MSKSLQRSTVTISKIAELAGTSKATVSRIINGNTKVNPETKKKVLSVIEDVGYVPNKTAQSLAGNPAKIIGVVLCEIKNFFFMELMEGIDSVISEAGYSMHMGCSYWDQEREDSIVNSLKSFDVDGVILNAVSPSAASITMLKERNIPFVLVNSIPDDSEIPFVIGDNYRGGSIIAEKLNSSPIKQVLIVCGYNDQPMRIRLKGIVDNLTKPYRVISFSTKPTDTDRTELVERILGFHENAGGPVAVFFSNDSVAVSMESLLCMKAKIPEEISIIGYDNIEPTLFCRVPLSTVNQKAFEMGSEAAKVLLNLIESGEVKEIKHFIEPEYIERESTLR